MQRPRKYAPFLLITAALAVLLTLTPDRAQGTSIGWTLDTIVSGTPPISPTPWLAATINDGGGSGSVTLTLFTNLDAGSGDFVEVWNFNFDPSLDVSLLSASAPVVVTGAFDAPTMSTGADAFAAVGDGSFDIQFSFFTGGNPNKTFDAGDSLQVVISSSEAITTDSFNFVSAGGVFHTAAAIDNGPPPPAVVGDGIVIPEPSSLVLLGLGAVALLFVRRRRRFA